MTVWKAVLENERFSVAIYNFASAAENHLSLDVGDLVEAVREYGDWFYGHKVQNPTVQGTYPKNYVCPKTCTVESIGGEDFVYVSHTSIVHEMTQTLREWSLLWKKLYLNKHESFKFIEVSMRTLLELRREILSGNLPQDKIRKIEKTAIYTMDKGNRYLGLDLRVRSAASGEQVDPFELSTCQLNTLHDETNARIEKMVDPLQTTSSHSQQSHLPMATGYRFLTSIRNFVVKMSEDAELLLSLYDGITFKQLTENYVVRWSKGGLPTDIDNMYNLKVVFTDLGNSDIKREKTYLVCAVIRIGGMDTQNNDKNFHTVTQSMIQTGKMLSSLGINPPQSYMRRPLGIAAMEVTRMLAGNIEVDESRQYCVPFYPCEKDNLDTLLRRIIQNKDLKGDNKSGQGLWISLKLMRDDNSQIVDDFIGANASVARKMGFPEVIMPGDARNDLYITLVGGSFSKGGGKSNDRNIEVTVKVCDQDGQAIPGVISLGGGSEPQHEYTSVVYHHEDKPRWMETFKVCITIEEFKMAHLLFLFRHRSSNEAKDRSGGYFAMAYAKLLRPDGTTIPDVKHTLALYKVDSKKWPNKESEAASTYLTLPCYKNDLPTTEKENKLQKGFLTLVHKDYVEIETLVCSTKLTQNVEVLGVLSWQESCKNGDLKSALVRLNNAPGSEAVKFLQDLLDALFHILTQGNKERSIDCDSNYDLLVYNCLLYIFTLVTDHKFHHFQSVLDVYIKKNFYHAQVYKKLIDLLVSHCERIPTSEGPADTTMILKSLKCLEYLVRFIVRSRELHAAMTRNSEDHEFHTHLEVLFNCMLEMMRLENNAALTSQGTCIKFLPSTVPHLVRVYPAERLSMKIGEILAVLPPRRLTIQRLMAIEELLQGPLFHHTTCRIILLPKITTTLQFLIHNHDEFHEAHKATIAHLPETSGYGPEIRSMHRSVDKVLRFFGTDLHNLEEERGYGKQLSLCLHTLSEILTLLHRKDIGPTEEEYRIVARDVLTTVVRATAQIEQEYRRFEADEKRDDILLRQIVTVLLDLLRQMTDEQYRVFINSMGNESKIYSFLTETQLILLDLIERPVYKTYWSDMINVQNMITLQTIRHFSITLRERFLTPFEKQIWQDWFSLTIAVITQNALQLDKLSQRQKHYIMVKYGDMRKEAAGLFNIMWFAMEGHRRKFIPHLVGPLLEVSLIPEQDVRKLTIPIFFDMMECEAEVPGESSDSSDSKGFSSFENEMIDKLDELVESGKGDTSWRALFVSIVGKKCAEHDSLNERGFQFVAIVGRLMDILLQYRDSLSIASIGHKMQVTTHILDFYKEIERPHMYIRYVYKLCALHEACENWSEAAKTLQLHANLLSWLDIPLHPRLRSLTHTHLDTHMKLKRSLYLDIVDLLSKGKMWELAIEICKELVAQYETEVFDYFLLSDLYSDMSNLYIDIMKKPRQELQYFRVGYYGMGFPEFWRNREFIYRGREVERLYDFCERLMDELPNAQLMTKLESPPQETRESPGQYVQINAVEPMMSDRMKRLSGKPVSTPILTYHKCNNVNRFCYSRPFQRKDPFDDRKEQDEFATLWLERTEMEVSDSFPGILCWFPVTKQRTYEMTPIEVAVQNVENSNKDLKTLVLNYKADEALSLNSLSMKLHGMIKADVMGGISRYEKLFLNEMYEKNHPEHARHIVKLKDLIADLVPILEFGIEIHNSRVKGDLLPHHEMMVENFEKMKEHIYTHYGKKSCDLNSEVPYVTMRRRKNADSIVSDNNTSVESSNRNTNSSILQGFQKQLQRNSVGNSNPATGNSRGSSVLSTIQRKKDREKKKKERIERGDSRFSSSQWYTQALNNSGHTDASPTVLELRQELRASRPLRTEAEIQRRLSQQGPNSIQSDIASNRNSVVTTDSNHSNHDDDEFNPPPLPQKCHKNDDIIAQALNNNVTAPATDLILGTRYNYDQVVSPRNSFLYSSTIQSTHVVRIKNGDCNAPTPPPKKRDSKGLNNVTTVKS